MVGAPLRQLDPRHDPVGHVRELQRVGVHEQQLFLDAYAERLAAAEAMLALPELGGRRVDLALRSRRLTERRAGRDPAEDERCGQAARIAAGGDAAGVGAAAEDARGRLRVPLIRSPPSVVVMPATVSTVTWSPSRRTGAPAASAASTISATLRSRTLSPALRARLSQGPCARLASRPARHVGLRPGAYAVQLAARVRHGGVRGELRKPHEVVRGAMREGAGISRA